MLNLEIGELYGLKSQRELIEAIQACRNMGMSDAQIQEILDRSKEDKYGKEKIQDKT